MARDGIHTNDRQLACARINSKEGQDYLVRSCMSLRREQTLTPGLTRVTAGGHGLRCELRVGEPQLDDVSVQTGALPRNSRSWPWGGPPHTRHA